MKVTTNRSARFKLHFIDSNGRAVCLIPGVLQFREKLKNLLLFTGEQQRRVE